MSLFGNKKIERGLPSACHLKELGIDPFAQAERMALLSPDDQIRELNTHLKSYLNEVLEDKALSILYSYWWGKNNRLYVSENDCSLNLAENMFDKRERGGYSRIGFKKMEKMLASSLNKVILWYSPMGQASFDDNPDNPFTQIGRYSYGQLYVLVNKGKRIDAVAIKTKDNGLDFLRKLFKDTLGKDQRYGYKSGEKMIKHFLAHPVETKLSFDQFINHLQDNYDLSEIIYENKYHQRTTLLSLLENLFLSFKEKKGSIFLSTIKFGLQENDISGEEIRNAFLQEIYFYQQKTGEKTTVLSGSCGGTEIEQGVISHLLGLDIIAALSNPMSSFNHFMAEKILGERESKYYEDYECPNCHQIIPGEKKRDPSSWKKNCPKCGKLISCR